MDRPALKEKHKQEILHLAQDVFNSLSSRIFPENPIPKAIEKSHFKMEVGKACSYKQQFGRRAFREILSKEYPDEPMGSRQFVSWFQQVMKNNYCDEKEPFSEVFQTTGLMFEAVVYAVEKGHINLYKILPFMWTEYFMQRMYPAFYKKGGWLVFEKKTKDIVLTYETFYITSEAGAMELIAGFREDDPTTDPGDSDSSNLLPVPPSLQEAGFPPFVSRDSNLAQTLTRLINLRLQETVVKPIMQGFNIPHATHETDLPGSTKPPEPRKLQVIGVRNISTESSSPDSPAEDSRRKGTTRVGRKKRGSSSRHCK